MEPVAERTVRAKTAVLHRLTSQAIEFIDAIGAREFRVSDSASAERSVTK